jgi:hypothetical protein
MDTDRLPTRNSSVFSAPLRPRADVPAANRLTLTALGGRDAICE